MKTDRQPSLGTTPLAGARIWLSGAVTEIEGSSQEQRDAIIGFVRLFARQVFVTGGHIVHGSHPSFTPALIEEAKRYQDQGGRKDGLVLAVSRLWSKDPSKVPVDDWREYALVYETPEVGGDDAHGKSLALLRKWMAARSDAIVVVGGKWWQSVGGRAGVPVEIALAMDLGLPCFLLGGFGGAAQGFVDQHPEMFSRFKNGLSPEVNREFSTKRDVSSLADEVCILLGRLPLVRGKGSDGISFRILALDGGGLKGAYTAAAIATWEAQTGLRVVDHFDLIAGTSTGGILALGLGLGLTGQQMLDFYKHRGAIIFPMTRTRGRIWHWLRHLVLPKYSQEVLLRELEKAFYGKSAHKHLGDSHCLLLIPAYHAVAGGSHLFRTPHHPDLNGDAQIEAAHVALATSAAPTFFSAAKIANMVTESSYFDGGVWANSPAMAAIIEATCILRVPLERIDILSVGTTEKPFSARQATRAGVIGWVWRKRILELLTSVQQESSLRLARQLVGDTHFLRVNTTTVPGSYKLDGAKEIGELADLGNRSASEPAILGQVKSRFLNGITAAPWEAY